MATVTHTIYSHYDPQDREKLEFETGQVEDIEPLDSAAVWESEASQIYRRKLAAPPRFIPATRSYDDWGSNSHTSTSQTPLEGFTGKNVAVWYRSLTSGEMRPSNLQSKKAETPSIQVPPSPKTVPEKIIPSSDRKNKNNWFIMKAIQSEPSTSPAAPPPTLADILARNPPPLPSEGRYAPPVWIEIGPSNKGFAMLQRGGWSEGEPLGPHVARRKPGDNFIPTFLDDEMPKHNNSNKGKAKQSFQGTVSKEVIEVKVEDHDDISELRQVDVVDLTLSDSDSDSELDSEDSVEFEDNLKLPDVKAEPTAIDNELHSRLPADFSTHGGKALLTPIATVLKSDRLGIGLKAKTVGPYKASQKRITHNAAAMAAHIKAAEEIKKRKKQVGGGRKRFERQRRKEETDRKAMLAYLNT